MLKRKKKKIKIPKLNIWIYQNLNLKLIKFFNLILSEFTFAGDIINGYWIKFMSIKVVTDLDDHLFHQNRDREIIFQNCLASLWWAIQKIDPCDVLILVFLGTALVI